MTDTDLRALAEAAIEKAYKTVDDLCQGRQKWVMHVPAQPDRDPDLVIIDALRLAKEALDAANARAERAEAVVAAAKAYVRERRDIDNEWSEPFYGFEPLAAAVDALEGGER